jgi:hypothetical protein
MNKIDYKIADTKELLMQSYQLVYQRYLEVGFCKANKTKMYFGFHELLTDTRTFVAVFDGKVIATLSVIIDNVASLPSDHLFSNELNKFRDQSRKIAEISRFAVRCDFKKKSVFILQYLFQLIYHTYVISSNVTDCVILVEPKHCKIYKKFNFVEASDVKLDEDAENVESKLMLLKLRENRQLVQYPCFANALIELKGFLPILNEALLKHQEINTIYKKFLSNRISLSSQELKLFSFRGFLMNSYLYKTKIELENKNLFQSAFHYSKIFGKLLENWPNNYLDQLRMQAEQLMNSCKIAGLKNCN